MSTVLEALRAQQRSAVGITPPVPPPFYRQPRTWLSAAAGSIVLAALLALLHSRDSRPTPSTAGAALPQPAALQPVEATPHAALAPPSLEEEAHLPAVPSRPMDEVPRGVVEKAAPPAKSVPVAKPKQAATRVAARHTAAPQPSSAADITMPAGTGVQLKAVRYSPDATKRAATLMIGAETATLREGDTAHGIEVQLILPDRVYVREGGSVSAITRRP